MTYLALNHSNYINGVTIKHKEVSRDMFSDYPIESITNGVHHLFWTNDYLKDVYNKYLGDSWIKTPFSLQYVFEIKKALKNSKIKIVFLEGYNLSIVKKLVSGVDLWLNTPQIPLEASGTSGMKAAFNGIPSLSSLDGWWLEGHIENVTGWSIGKRGENTTSDYNESDELYGKLEKDILLTYYHNKEQWKKIMVSTIMVNASMFNSHRMVKEYILNSYL